MTFSAKLGFKNPSSSQDLNETQAKIIHKGIYDGGSLGLSGISLNVTIAPFVAVGYDGMVVVSDATETLTVVDGQQNYIVLLARYEQRTTPTIQFQVLDDVSWTGSIHSDYFINWAMIDLSSGGYGGVTAAEVYYDESDWSEKVGKSNWKTSVATVGDLPTDKNLDGDTRMVTSGYKPYVWKAATQAWEEAFDSEASLVAYAGGPNWHDGTTNPATTVEAQLDKIVTDLVGETGGGGADKIGCGSRSNWYDTTTNPVGSVYDALEKVITDLSASGGATKMGCAARTAWYDTTTNPITSIYGAIEKIVTDLISTTGDGGADKIGCGSLSSWPLASDSNFETGSVHDRISSIIDDLSKTAAGTGVNAAGSTRVGAPDQSTTDVIGTTLSLTSGNLTDQLTELITTIALRPRVDSGIQTFSNTSIFSNSGSANPALVINEVDHTGTSYKGGLRLRTGGHVNQTFDVCVDDASTGATWRTITRGYSNGYTPIWYPLSMADGGWDISGAVPDWMYTDNYWRSNTTNGSSRYLILPLNRVITETTSIATIWTYTQPGAARTTSSDHMMLQIWYRSSPFAGATPVFAGTGDDINDNTADQQNQNSVPGSPLVITPGTYEYWITIRCGLTGSVSDRVYGVKINTSDGQYLFVR